MLETDSWEGLGPGVFASGSAAMGTETGCGRLSFKASVSMLPDTLEAGAPAGYSLDLRVPQNSEPERLATPTVKNTAVTLPLGTVISPSVADGLGDCTNAQFFGLGPREAAPAMPGECPRASQIGIVRVKTPALEEPLTGAVYLLRRCVTRAPRRTRRMGGWFVCFCSFRAKGKVGLSSSLKVRGRSTSRRGS